MSRVAYSTDVILQLRSAQRLVSSHFIDGEASHCDSDEGSAVGSYLSLVCGLVS